MDLKMHIGNSIIRGILGLITGLLMILWPGRLSEYLIMFTGILFIIAGIWAIFKHRTLRPLVYTVVSAASILLGAWLLAQPQTFINILMYIWGAMLISAGIQQILSIVSARRQIKLPYGFYILPALISIAGMAIIFHPAETMEYTLILLGIVTLLYGINELINYYKLHTVKRDTVAEVEPDGDTPGNS